MNGVLVIAGCQGNVVDPTTSQLVTAARALGGPVTLGVVATDPRSVGGTDIEGVDRILGIRVAEPPTGQEVALRSARKLVDVVAPRFVLLPFTWEASAYASGLAESRDMAFICDVQALEIEGNTLIASRETHGGKVVLRLALSSDRPAVLLLRTEKWSAASEAGDPPEMEMVETESDPSSMRLIRQIEAPVEDKSLVDAEVIFGIGRGVGKREHVAVFEALSAKLDVGLGASRPLVDVGLVDRGRQVGQSGVKVQPKLYVAFGISGAMQHIEGMSGSKVIVAVNTDEGAPIFDVAHYGALVDAMEVANHLLTDE